MGIYDTDPRVSALSAGELKLAKALMHNNRMTEEQFGDFLGLRERFEREGKRYLGDILVERGYIPHEVIDEFFAENNELYIKFLDRLIDNGFLREEEREKIMADEDSKTKVVSVLEKLGIMTKENFIQLFSKRVNSLRLGDWLLAKRKISEADLKKALLEQNIYRLEDYLVFNGILKEDFIRLAKEKLGL